MRSWKRKLCRLSMVFASFTSTLMAVVSHMSQTTNPSRLSWDQRPVSLPLQLLVCSAGHAVVGVQLYHPVSYSTSRSWPKSVRHVNKCRSYLQWPLFTHGCGQRSHGLGYKLCTTLFTAVASPPLTLRPSQSETASHSSVSLGDPAGKYMYVFAYVHPWVCAICVIVSIKSETNIPTVWIFACNLVSGYHFLPANIHLWLLNVFLLIKST